MRVSIIGGGVVGLTTAYALVRQGVAVDMIDARSELASETSFANGGQLSYRYVAPLADAGVPMQAIGWLLKSNSPLKLRPRLDMQQWKWMAEFLLACRSSVNQANAQKLLELALHSRDTLHNWLSAAAIDDFAWRRNGKLVAFRDEASFKHHSKHLSDPQNQRVVTRDGLATLDTCLSNTPFVGGIFTPDEEVGDCYKFCQSLVKELASSNLCNFVLGKPVTDVVHRNGVIEKLRFGNDELDVQNLVLCTGYKTSALKLPLLSIPIYPLKGYSLTVPISKGNTAPEVSITDYDRKIVYARLDDKLRVAAMVDIVGFNPEVDPGRINAIRSAAQELFPNGGNYREAVEWAGMRPATPTGVPIIGATPHYKNLWLNVGHGALGFTLACGSADLLANLISERKAPLNPQLYSYRTA